MNRKDLPSQEYLKECFDYNPNTGEVKWKERPIEHFNYNRSTYGRFTKLFANKPITSYTEKKYYQVSLCNEYYLLHRIIWKLYYGIEPPYIIDHINNIRTDNRIANLRGATILENCRNKNSLISSNTSGYLGITYINKNKRYRVTINYENITIYVGEFKDVNEARVRRVMLEKALYKDYYAKTDDIEDSEYYHKYINSLTEEQMIKYTTIPDKIKNVIKNKQEISDYVGVSITASGKYRGTFGYKRKSYSTKVFDTPEEASLARENKLKELKSLDTNNT
jgi:hypothetical protein